MAHDYINMNSTLWLELSDWLQDESIHGSKLVMSAAGVASNFQNNAANVATAAGYNISNAQEIVKSALECGRMQGLLREFPDASNLGLPSSIEWSTFKNQFFITTSSSPANNDWPFVRLLVANNSSQDYRMRAIRQLLQYWVATMWPHQLPSRFSDEEVDVLKAIAEQWEVND